MKDLQFCIRLRETKDFAGIVLLGATLIEQSTELLSTDCEMIYPPQ